MSGRPKAGRARQQLYPILLATGAVAVLILFGVGFLLGRGGSLPAAKQDAKPSLPGVGEKPAAQIEASGRLLVPFDTGLSLVKLPDRKVTDAVRPAQAGAITGARWSPDGKGAAYALYHVRAGDSAASSEIFLTDLAGEPRLLAGRDRPGAVLEAPAWTPDGRAVYFGYTALEGQALVRRIERVEVDSGARSPVTEGILPEVSPDGSQLALIRSDRNGDSLVVMPTAGGEARPLIPAGKYSVLGAPRFSPDGRSLAVPISVPPTQVREPSPATPFGFLGTSVAHAHGDPWELYLLPIEGGEPRQVTRLVEDEISAAWSPQGDKLVVYGSRGVYLVEPDGRTTYILDRGGYGGIDWAR